MAPCATGWTDSASRTHATHVSNLACPGICAVEAIGLLLLWVRPRPKTLELHSKSVAGKTEPNLPGGRECVMHGGAAGAFHTSSRKCS
jgi:hypothetical protein